MVRVTSILFSMEQKLKRISPVLQYKNICLHVLTAKEMICVFLGQINMPTALSGISSAFVVNRLSNKDTTCHCSFRFNMCTVNVTSTMTQLVSTIYVSGTLREDCRL
jgi:hypothetical protein